MTEKTFNVLFLCTGNSARSIMAEALLSTLGRGRFRGFSAGSKPTGKVNPFAIEQVRGTGYSLGNLRSKSWEEFAAGSAAGSRHMDVIITVCDSAAGETCPFWPGRPATAHWGFEDPAAVEGTEQEKRAAFEKVFRQIKNRIEAFVNLPLDTLENPAAIRRELDRIGNGTADTPLDYQLSAN